MKLKRGWCHCDNTRNSRSEFLSVRLNLSSSAILAWKILAKNERQFPFNFLQHFTWNLSIDIVRASLDWAIALSHGFSPALLKTAEKSPWECPFKWLKNVFNYLECVGMDPGVGERERDKGINSFIMVETVWILVEIARGGTLFSHLPRVLRISKVVKISCFVLRCTGRHTDTPRQQVNRLTSYIDGSVVYGESETRNKALREFKDGKLKLGPDGLIPVSTSQPSTFSLSTECQYIINHT